jgi:hypothetical protein
MPCPYIWGGVQGHGMPCPFPLARWRERGTQGVRAKRRACPREFVNLFKHRKPHQRQRGVRAGERRVQPVRGFVCHIADGGQPLRCRLLDLHECGQHGIERVRLDDADGASPLQPARLAVGGRVPQQHIGSSWRNLRVAQRAKGYPSAQRHIKGR